MMLYTISEAAVKMQLTSYTLRYYDREGLIPFVERSAGGVRMFKEKDFGWIRLIGCMKATGMPIKEIKQFVDWYMEGDSTLQLRRDMFYERKKLVEEQIESLQKTLNTIKYKCWFYDTAVAAGTTSVPKNMKPEDMPDEIRELKGKIDL
ncbi:MerR family transcriptional regulator [Paenibacillus foliorum]|nr:MerR family transcriptional regulator [Paenibacillus foliorum]